MHVLDWLSDYGNGCTYDLEHHKQGLAQASKRLLGSRFDRLEVMLPKYEPMEYFLNWDIRKPALLRYSPLRSVPVHPTYKVISHTDELSPLHDAESV